MTRVRRTAIVALAAGLMVTSAAGCATAPGTQAWPGPSHGTGEATITIVSGTDASISAGDKPVRKGEPGMYQELVDWWNKYEAPIRHIKVQLDVIAGGATVVHSEMLAAAENDDTSYDIYNLDSEWVPEFAAGGYIRSLQGHLPVRGFLHKPLVSGENAPGQLYAAPFTTDVGLLYYRKGLVTAVQTARLRNFDQVLSLAQSTMERHPGAGLTEGYAGQFGDYEGLTVNALEIIRGFGHAAFNTNGTIHDRSAVASGLTQLASAFTAVDASTASEIPRSELTSQEPQALTAFASGRAVLMRNWPIYYEQLAAAGQPGTGYVARHFAVAVAPLPFPSVLGGQDLAISAGSQHPAQALDFIKFLTSAEAERCLFAVGGFPATRRSAYDQGRSLPTGYGQVSGHRLCGTQTGGELQIAPKILRAIGTAIPRPVTGYYTEFSTVIQDQVWPMLSRASHGKNPRVSEVVTDLAAGIQAAATGRAPP